MGKIKKTIMTIPFDELMRVDDLFFKQAQMREDKVLKKFKEQYESTREGAFSKLSMIGMFESHEIDKIDDEAIHMAGGECLDSRMLVRLFHNADEIVSCALCVRGYSEYEESVEGNLEILFADAWGTAIVEAGYVWLKEQIKKELEAQNLNSTFSWSPGQHNIDVRLQVPLFALLKPEEIDITLTPSFMMHPKKSISGFIGIGTAKDMTDIRACDVCERRETCPSAYA